MSEPAKDEAELMDRVAKAFCCPSPSGCVDNINCDRLDFQIDAIRALAAIRAAGWAVVPVDQAWDILVRHRAENARLREALTNASDETFDAIVHNGIAMENLLKNINAALEVKQPEPICVNAHDRCYGGAGGPCPYCEMPAAPEVMP